MSEEKAKFNGTESSQRLPSLKPPRDLSLGGIKPKKVFIPNLNVSRNKSKGASSSSQESKNEDRHHRDRKDRHRSKNGPNVIKSAGVFSEGLGNTERRSTRGPYTRDASDATPQTLQRPTIRVKDVVKIDKELEEQKIKHVMNEAGSEQEENYDFRRVRETDAPIKLPMDDGGFHRQKNAVKVKQEVIVKTEPMDEEYTNVVKPIASVKKETCDAPDLVNLLKSEEPKIMLMQFPQSLPGRGGSRDDDERPRHRDKPAPPSKETAEEIPQVVDNSCCLSDLEEGKIGKLRVYHSGRVTLKLGDTEFEVSMGTQAAFHQELVSVACDDNSRSANIVSLGPLAHKLNIVPDWEKMFSKMNV